MVTWRWISFKAFTTNELYEILQLRQKVFILEQQCMYLDVDDKDQQAMHLVGSLNHQCVAYARFFSPNIIYENFCSFGRVLVAPDVRGLGYAKLLIHEILRYAAEHTPEQNIKISAQCYLEKFYNDLGFTSKGKPYDDGGIAHIEMIFNARTSCKESTL